MTSAKGTVLTRWKRLCFDFGSDGSSANHHVLKADDDARSAASGSAWDSLRFLLEWLRDPIGTAALVPSSKALVSLITGSIDRHAGAVLELGPGTGVFTHGLVARGVAECDLTLVEQNPTFARLLKRRFPRATVLGIDAADLSPLGAEARAFGAAVCGLGLRNMESGQVESILHAAFTRMKPGAALYLFTYGLRCSVADEILERLGLDVERIGTTLRNVPPASVYRIARLSDAR